MKTKSLLLILLTAFGAIITPLYVDAATAPDAPDPNMKIDLTGAGATFPYPLIDKWRVEYKLQHDNVNLNYQSIGSGGGVKQHIEKTVNFAASDAPLTEAERKLAPGTLHIPETIGGVAVVYNLAGEPNKALKLNADVLSQIFSGSITKWNDSAIKKINPNYKLPKTDIVTVHRSDGSGTTYIFTDYLSTVSSSWEEQVGKGKSVSWPNGLAGKGNGGVAAIVKSTPNSIGYVELAYANQARMQYADIQNAQYGDYIKPSLASIKAASEGAAPKLPNAEGDWSKVSIVNAPGPKSYPIASFSYLLVYGDLKEVTQNKEQAKAVIHLMNWMVTDGQQFSPKLDYVPLDAKTTSIALNGLKQIKYDGEVIWGGADKATADKALEDKKAADKKAADKKAADKKAADKKAADKKAADKKAADALKAQK
ncbi:MAG: phosphate ABC transporter substrate-binding protein PstS [Candidatus Nitrosopumilus limneticus]|nr:phosphate ABC transporter substrate-binding protein PstS [Candidatus Nitrosopumilus limneticus]